MIERFIGRLSATGDHPGMVPAILRIMVLVLALVFLLELLVPVRMSNSPLERDSILGVTGDAHLAVPQRLANIDIKRKGLFRPSTPLTNKPMAEGTVEKIKSQLKVQCIMEMNKEPVAYININGIGLRKCKVGETVQDLFTVIGINSNSVEITIIGHKAILNL